MTNINFIERNYTQIERFLTRVLYDLAQYEVTIFGYQSEYIFNKMLSMLSNCSTYTGVKMITIDISYLRDFHNFTSFLSNFIDLNSSEEFHIFNIIGMDSNKIEFIKELNINWNTLKAFDHPFIFWIKSDFIGKFRSITPNMSYWCSISIIFRNSDNEYDFYSTLPMRVKKQQIRCLKKELEGNLTRDNINTLYSELVYFHYLIGEDSEAIKYCKKL